jgi:hypothetical protein
MGQQQLLFIIIAVIIVGIAIAVGISIVSAQTVATFRDSIINDLNHLASYAYDFRIRLRSMGGGQGDYSGFTIPTKMKENEDALFTVVKAEVNSVVLCAASIDNPSNTVQVTVGVDGKINNWTFGGEFQ